MTEKTCGNCTHRKPYLGEDGSRCTEGRSPVYDMTAYTAESFSCCYWADREPDTSGGMRDD